MGEKKPSEMEGSSSNKNNEKLTSNEVLEAILNKILITVRDFFEESKIYWDTIKRNSDNIPIEVKKMLEKFQFVNKEALKSVLQDIEITVKEKSNWLILIIASIVAFGAALGGAYVGAYWGNAYQQKMIDNGTKTKIKLMYLETQYNAFTSQKMYDSFSNAQKTDYGVDDLGDFAARTVLQDGNISKVLEPYQISLIQSYIAASNTVNKLKARYCDYLDVIKYNITPDGVNIRDSIKKNVAAFMATLFMVQGEFKIYFDDFRGSYDYTKAEELKEEMKKMKEKILKGEVAFTK